MGKRRTNQPASHSTQRRRLKYSLRFALRETSADQWGNVQISVAHNYSRIRLSIRRDHEMVRHFAVEAESWDDRRMIPLRGPNKSRVTSRIEELANLVHDYFDEIDKTEESADLSELEGILRGSTNLDALRQPFIRLFKKFVKEYRVNGPRGRTEHPSQNTVATYRTTLGNLKKYDTWRRSRGEKALRLDDFCISSKGTGTREPRVVSEFRDFMVDHLGLKPISAWRGLKILATALRWIESEGMAGDREVFSKAPREPEQIQDHPSLRPEEIDRINNLRYQPGSRKEDARMAFLLQLQTGLRYSDISQVNPALFPEQYQRIKQRKTGDYATILHSSPVREILQTWAIAGVPTIVQPGRNGRMTKSAKYNPLVREICREAGNSAQMDHRFPRETDHHKRLPETAYKRDWRSAMWGSVRW